MSDNHLEEISRERKEGIENGTIPPWYTTPGYQMFKSKYQYEGQTVKESFQRIANTAAHNLPRKYKDEYEQKFFDLLWKGWLSPSTPVMANMGTTRGCPVSCSGGYVEDSVHSFYTSRTETAMLTKHGFGTSSYLGDIRPRGSSISVGGTASGILPELKAFIQLSSDVSQGSTRRGAWAGYLSIEHDDFYEVANHLLNHPDDCNIGWNIHDTFIERLDNGDADALERYQYALKIKCVTGKGYFLFVDRVNRASPECYKKRKLDVKASNLCSEVMLHSDKNHTFTCVLSSMNAFYYDDWKDTDAVQTATIFLDCVAQEFINQGKDIQGLENAVRFTEKSRALGLGLLGFHSYLQKKRWAFESFDSFNFNTELFQHLKTESLEASRRLVEIHGYQPDWLIGTDRFNSHLLAVAPNASSALLAGGLSQGIEPIVDNVFNQTTPAGEIRRINPELLSIMKKRHVYNKATLTDIIDNNGSVQHVDWLSEAEKHVFKTAFEIRQEAILEMASSRQKYIDQGQSLNLFFDADEDENHISAVHKQAFKDPYIKALYYMRSKAGVQASKDTECLACEG